MLATIGSALCFSVWGFVAPLAPQFQEHYRLSNTQISVVIATPVILGSLFRIPLGLLTDRFGGRVIFTGFMLVVIVPVLFIGLLGGSFGGILFWGSFLGLAGASFAVGVPFVNKWFPPHMGLALGIYGMGNIGMAVAAYSAPAIAAFCGWQWAFWAFIIPLIAMAAIFWSSSGSSGVTPEHGTEAVGHGGDRTVSLGGDALGVEPVLFPHLRRVRGLEMRKLIVQGPPQETVGLEPYTADSPPRGSLSGVAFRGRKQ